MGRKRGGVVVLGAVLALGMGAPLRGETLGEGWTYRRALAFKAATSDAPGENLAYTEFYTNGAAKPDGSDLRVTTAAGVVVPRKVMQVEAGGDLVRLAFVTHGGGPYYVWWGNSEAAAPGGEPEIRRGVCAEVFKSAGGTARNVASLEQMFERATPVGATFVPNVYLGYNPLGEERGALVRYRAQFKIEPAIRAEFAFTVMDAGALLIDGKAIATDFRNGFQGRVRDPKAVDLAAGWHLLEVLQANEGSGNTGVSVAWQRPNEKGFSTLPLSILAPVAQATAGPLEKVGVGATEDFTIEPVAEAFVPPASFIARYTFDAVLPGGEGGTMGWDFGDGQRMSGEKKVNHYFLTPGVYTVTLSLKQGVANVTTTSRRIVVGERAYALFPKPPQDSPATVRGVLRDYDVQKLSGPQAMRGMLFFKDQGEGMEDLTLAWGKAWLGAKDAPADSVTFDETRDLARALEKRKSYAQAAACYQLASEKPIGMPTRLNLMRHEVMERCDELDDAAGALARAREWEGKVNKKNGLEIRTEQAAVLFAAIAAGDQELARKTLAEPSHGAAKSYGDSQIQQGVLARNIESAIGTKDYDTAEKLIDQWEVDYPEAIWVGFTRTLRVKLLEAEGRPVVAGRIAVQHARANPNGFYAAELLYRGAEDFKAAGEATLAKAARELLSSKYPESPYARGAEVR